MEDLNPICTLEVNGKKLFVIYSKRHYGLYSLFSADKRMYQYIQDNREDAFYSAIDAKDSNNYVLNIASTNDFGYFEWKNNITLLNYQLDIFAPIIQMFITEATAERLKYTPEDEQE